MAIVELLHFLVRRWLLWLLRLATSVVGNFAIFEKFRKVFLVIKLCIFIKRQDLVAVIVNNHVFLIKLFEPVLAFKAVFLIVIELAFFTLIVIIVSVQRDINAVLSRPARSPSSTAPTSATSTATSARLSPSLLATPRLHAVTPSSSATAATSTTVPAAAPAFQADLVFIVHLELALVRDAAAIHADQSLARDRIVHHVRIQLLLLTNLCGFLADVAACGAIRVTLPQRQ
mmetsp:Transcript_5475/g.7311  ORF Transcript_5475/g.7311 Transcript_5475/m.7311 type:complete len:230 (-) Transcript_5475:724-1413(-)